MSMDSTATPKNKSFLSSVGSGFFGGSFFSTATPIHSNMQPTDFGLDNDGIKHPSQQGPLMPIYDIEEESEREGSTAPTNSITLSASQRSGGLARSTGSGASGVSGRSMNSSTLADSGRSGSGRSMNSSNRSGSGRSLSSSERSNSRSAPELSGSSRRGSKARSQSKLETLDEGKETVVDVDNNLETLDEEGGGGGGPKTGKKKMKKRKSKVGKDLLPSAQEDSYRRRNSPPDKPAQEVKKSNSRRNIKSQPPRRASQEGQPPRRASIERGTNNKKDKRARRSTSRSQSVGKNIHTSFP